MLKGGPGRSHPGWVPENGMQMVLIYSAQFSHPIGSVTDGTVESVDLSPLLLLTCRNIKEGKAVPSRAPSQETFLLCSPAEESSGSWQVRDSLSKGWEVHPGDGCATGIHVSGTFLPIHRWAAEFLYELRPFKA